MGDTTGLQVWGIVGMYEGRASTEEVMLPRSEEMRSVIMTA
jgi:hypothetical protein